MAHEKKVFMNKITGEVIWRYCRLSAWLYFKADGKKLGYKVSNKNILDADGIKEVYGTVFHDMVLGKSRN